jgi:predicted metal-dependent hydrolase
MNQKFPYILRISEKAKHVRFQVSVEQGLEVVVPKRFSISRVPSLVEKNSQWIERAFQKPKAFLPDYRQLDRQLRNGSRWMPGWLTASCGAKSGKLGVGRQANQMQSSAFI